MKAYYRLREGDRVKDLPEDAQIAFKKIPGGQPEVDFMEGSFWTLKWREWDVERIRRNPGDYLVEAENYGISIVPADTVIAP